MTKLETLETQRAKTQRKLEDYLAKAKKEEDRLKDLETQIILAKHEERSDYLACCWWKSWIKKVLSSIRKTFFSHLKGLQIVFF